MKIARDHEYTHGTDALYALFTDAEEITAKLEAIGARDIHIEECETTDEGASVSFVREMPAEVPGVLSKFLQPWNAIEQTEQWQDCGDGIYRADLDFDIANVPVTLSGTLELEPTDAGCVNHVRVKVECGIPFIGKTLAEYVGYDCLRIMGEEYEYLTDRLG